MEGWEDGIILSTIIAAIGYLFFSKVAQGKSITSLEVKLDHIIATQANMQHQISEDQHEMKQRQEEIKERQKEIDAKLNLFIKTEVDTLKELARQGFTQRQG